MSTPTFANYFSQACVSGDQLFAKTDWTLANVQSAPAFGASLNGTDWSSTGSLVGLIDCRPYRTIKLYVYIAAYTGTSITPRMFAFDQSTHPGGNYWPYSVTGKALATGGGGQMFVLQDGVVPTVQSSGGANFDTDIILAPKPSFCQFYLNVNTVTAMATGALRTFVYGER